MFELSGGVGVPVVRDVLEMVYTGDDTNNREIDLGKDFDLIVIVAASGPVGPADDKLQHARASGARYEAQISKPSSSDQDHYFGAAADALFQGKLTGADATKIKLGSTGITVWGTNAVGYTYRIRAWQFAVLAP